MTLLYFVSGMFCGTCAKTVESRVRALPKVSSAELSFASRLLKVELAAGVDPDLASMTIEKEITKSGFGVKRQKEGWLGSFLEQFEQERSQVIPAWLLCVVFFFAMWSSTAAFAKYLGSLPPQEEYLLACLSTLVGAPALLLGMVPFARAGWRALWTAGLPTIDLFVALGSVSALALSLGNLWNGSGRTYVDTQSMILVLLLGAKVVEGRLAQSMVGRVLYGINGGDPTISRLAPGPPRTVQASQVRRGDIVRFLTAETIAVDGSLACESARIDNHLLTGEPSLRIVREGGAVLAGSIARSPLQISVSDPVGNRLIDGWAESALTTRSRPHRYSAFVQKLESRLTSIALSGALLLGCLRYLTTASPMESAEAFFVGVLLFCPCLFASILPLAKQMAHVALARRGILCQRAESLFDLSAVQQLVFDKTGTIEALETCFVASDLTFEESVRRHLDELRRHSYHPVLEGLPPVERRLETLEAPQLEVFPGEGVLANWRRSGATLLVGRTRFVQGKVRGDFPDGISEDSTLVAWNGRLVGQIVTGKTYDQKARQALLALFQKLPPTTSVYVLSGDPKPLSPELKAFFETTGIIYQGDLSPTEKAVQLRENSLFVGDGLNDTPALSRATVSLRVGSRARGFTPVDLHLIEPDLCKLSDLFDYAQTFTKVLFQTALMAGLYNLVAWTLAALGYFTPLGAVFAMLSSLGLMTLSSLRLLRA